MNPDISSLPTGYRASSAVARITTPLGFRSTASEVAEGCDLSGKRVIVTGGASGIGVETARALAGIGAEVTLAVRNTEAGAQVAADITATTGNKAIHVAKLDLTDRASIRAFVAAWNGALHVLINNAGIMACPELRTAEGWEMQFATNHLGHFALAVGLHDALAAGGHARIVAVSSTAHMLSPVIFDDTITRKESHFERLRLSVSLRLIRIQNELQTKGVSKLWLLLNQQPGRHRGSSRLRASHLPGSR